MPACGSLALQPPGEWQHVISLLLSQPAPGLRNGGNSFLESGNCRGRLKQRTAAHICLNDLQAGFV